MAHIFISYSSQHRELTEQLATFLEGSGLDVWWDRELVARGPFEPQIKEQLRLAGCIVVLWTEGALASEWVRIEAEFAIAHDKLVNVRADDIKPARLSVPFRNIDCHGFSERDLILRDVLAVREGRLLLEDKREDLPSPGARTPTMLLQAKYNLVPFTGAQEIKADLLEWVVKSPLVGSGRLIHGPGGFGKTRLMIEVADALRAAGWSAGFLTRPDAAEDASKRERRAKALSHLIRGANDQGLLLVMDYAEGRNDEIARLAQAIRARPADDKRPIRLVLLSRGAGDWWKRLVEDDQGVRALFGGEQLNVQELGGITNGHDRLQLFVEAVKAFAPKLAEDGYSMPSGEPDYTRLARIESGDGYDRPLAIVMEAMLYLAAMAPGANEPGVASLLVNVLGLERARWPKLIGPLSVQNRRNIDRELQRAVAQVTGVQGVESRRAAEDLFMLDSRYPRRLGDRDSVDLLAENVTKIYGRGDTIAQLEPDLIGEHHVGLIADQELLDGCLAWIAAEPDQRARAGRQHDLITVLQRASRPEHGAAGVERACKLLDHLIIAHGHNLADAILAVMSDTPGCLFERLETNVDRLPKAALEIFNFKLEKMHVGWLMLSFAIARRYAQEVIAQIDANTPVPGEPQSLADHYRKHYEVASSLGTLASRLSNLGRLEEAINAARLSVEICEPMAQSLPEVFSDGLTTALINFGSILSDARRHREALEVTIDAVKVLRRLEVSGQDRHAILLATSLANLSSLQSELGNLDEVLAPSEESLAILRKLANNNPEIGSPELQTRLFRHAALLQKLGCKSDAVNISREAVDIGRLLAAKRPRQHLPDLAASLNNFSNDLSNIGLNKEAAACSGEAVEIRRMLARQEPIAFAAPLAGSLSNFANHLSLIGEMGKARAACQEAVDIVSRNPDQHLPDLAMYLNNLGIILGRLGQHDEALAVTQEATDIRRKLASASPSMFLDDLSQSLTNLANRLAEAGQLKESLPVAVEAVDIDRKLALSHPRAYGASLAKSLGALSIKLAELGEHLQAADSAKEGLLVIAPLVASDAQAYRGLAGALHQVYVGECRRSGQDPDANLLPQVSGEFHSS